MKYHMHINLGGKEDTRMLKCDGYKMFHGTVKVTPVLRPDGTRWKEPFDLTGTWLYKPDFDTWYCKPDNGGWTESWTPDILSDFREDV